MRLKLGGPEDEESEGFTTFGRGRIRHARGWDNRASRIIGLPKGAQRHPEDMSSCSHFGPYREGMGQACIEVFTKMESYHDDQAENAKG
jgi:hypothetical protein